MLNFLIPKAYAVGTLTTADTTAIIKNGIDSILDNIITNLPIILLPMIVVGLFFACYYWIKNQAFRKV